MPDLKVDSLPNEVFAEIFKWLDKSSLKNVVLTCKKWRDIAEELISWSLKLSNFPALYVKGRRLNSIDVLLSSSRKYTTVTIDNNLDLHDDTTIEVFKRIAPRVITFKLCYMKLLTRDLEKLQILFDLLFNLKRLMVINVSSEITTEEIEGSEIPLFPKLKELELVFSDCEMLEFFKKAYLTSLKVFNYHYSVRQITLKPTPAGPLQNFLVTQNNLEKLAIRSLNYSISKFFETPIADEMIQFRLKEFSVLTMEHEESPDDYINLLTFMKLHCKSIEKLEVRSKLPDFVFEFIFTEFTNLKTMLLNTDAIPKDDAFFDCLAINGNVNNLLLIGEIEGTTNQVFKHLPNVEHFENLNNCQTKKDTLKSIADNLQKLKSLRLFALNSEDLNNLEFPRLETLNVFTDMSINWEEMATAAPAISHLTIRQLVQELRDFKIKSLLQNFNIESLIINGCNELNQDFFDIICDHGSSLKSLNVVGLMPDVSTVAKNHDFKFKVVELGIEEPIGHAWENGYPGNYAQSDSSMSSIYDFDWQSRDEEFMDYDFTQDCYNMEEYYERRYYECKEENNMENEDMEEEDWYYW